MELEAFDRELLSAWQGRSPGLVFLHRAVSTQDLGRRLAHEYTREGVSTPQVDIVAWEQTSGEGQRAHRWSSPAGLGVYLTMVRSLEPGRHLQRLPMLCGVALCDLLNNWLEGRCRIKWPNDLLVDGRKIGGLLIELVSRGNDETIAILGFGLNRQGGPDEYRVPEATSLSAEGGSVPGHLELVEGLVDAIDAGLGQLSDSAQPLLDRYCELAIHRPGENLRCRVDEESVEGTFEGFDEHGFLQLRVAGETRVLSSGVVELEGRKDG